MNNWSERLERLARYEGEKLGLERPVSSASLGRLLKCSGRQIRLMRQPDYARQICERIVQAICDAEDKRGIR